MLWVFQPVQYLFDVSDFELLLRGARACTDLSDWGRIQIDAQRSGCLKRGKTSAAMMESMALFTIGIKHIDRSIVERICFCILLVNWSDAC